MDSKIEIETKVVSEPVKDKVLRQEVRSLTPEQRSLYLDIKNLRTEVLVRKTGEHTYPVEERMGLIKQIKEGDIEDLHQELALAKEEERKKKGREFTIENTNEQAPTPPIPSKLTDHKVPDSDFEMRWGGVPTKDRD